MHGERRVDGARRREQRLGGDLAAEHALPVGVGLAPAEQVDVEVLEVEQLDEVVGGGGHGDSCAVGLAGLAGVGGSGLVGVGSVEAGQELLELLADLLTGRQRLVVREQAAAALLGALEGVVLLLERRDDLADLLVGGEVAGDLGLAVLGLRVPARRGRW